MELILNLGWLLLAAACCCFWWPRRQRSGARAERRFRGFVALGCALVVLFPIISVTDDLHAEQAVMEDSSARVSKLRGNTSSAPIVGHHGPALPTIHPSDSYYALRVVGLVFANHRGSTGVGVAPPRFGRAPPSSLL